MLVIVQLNVSFCSQVTDAALQEAAETLGNVFPVTRRFPFPDELSDVQDDEILALRSLNSSGTHTVLPSSAWASRLHGVGNELYVLRQRF